ncbi:MAG: TetR/AcrR family transcriptional regulator C-terminal domain-containing protein [Actinomadura sp.]
MAPGNTRRPSRRRGPPPRHTREEVTDAAIALADADGFDAVTFRAVAARLGAGTMSLYSYVPDKQTLVHEMVERVSGELELPREPSGDWRADIRMMAGRQRAMLHRHPWLITALSHRQPFGPATLASLEFALAALEPTGLPARRCLETVGLLTGFIANFVRTELADSGAAPDPAQLAAESARLQELLATGRYPRFAAAVGHGGHPAVDLAAGFTHLLDRMLDGLIGPNDTEAETST